MDANGIERESLLTKLRTDIRSNLCVGGRVWEGRCNKEEEKITSPLYAVQHIHKFIYIIVNYTLNKLRIFLQLRFYFSIVFRSCTPPFKFLLYPMILLFVKTNICEIKFLTEKIFNWNFYSYVAWTLQMQKRINFFGRLCIGNIYINELFC